MAAINGNNSAFPLFDSNGDYAVAGEVNTLGLTKREVMTMYFMAQMLTTSRIVEHLEGTSNGTKRIQFIRNKALLLADSLLEGLDL